jgi:sugar O-acyltransferase (sialic acid O-acetyltransferase NeuD family)
MHNNDKILIYGASGHCKVILSIAESNNFEIEAIFDDYTTITSINNNKIVGKYIATYMDSLKIIVAIGNNRIRKKVTEYISHNFIKLIHPSAIVDAYSFVNLGTVVFHNSVIQRNTHIGKHCIINTNASIDHDCVIEDFVHISPSATLCGNVAIGEGTHIGAGATIIPNIKIGKWCVIGAGAVITKDVPDYSLVVGVPGKIIKKLGNE